MRHLNLVKVVGRYCGFTDGENLHAGGFHRNHIVDILQAAFNQEEFASDDREAVLCK